MSTNKTTNLNLHSWVSTDPVRRAEFNENFDAIDANAGETWDEVMGLKGSMPHIVVGSWTGNGEYGTAHPNRLSFDFTPKFLILCVQAETGYLTENYVGSTRELLFWGVTTTLYSYEGVNTVTYSGNTISWYSTNGAAKQYNSNNRTYHYIAVG